MQKNNRILFLNLAAFSKTGGIEKFNRSLLKALVDVEGRKAEVDSYSLHDLQCDEDYIMPQHYRGFGGKKITFILRSLMQARKYDLIILGHINLSVVGLLIKFFYPRKKIFMVAHGIEAWEPLTNVKKNMLLKSDRILAVSSFTQNKLVSLQHVDSARVRVFHNTIDPYFVIPTTFKQSQGLRLRYRLKPNDFVLFTLARLNSQEKYKGYDVVIRSLPQLLETIPNIRYVIGGRYDQQEKTRLDRLIADLGLEEVVVFTGFIRDEEVNEHYQMADLFIMPSQGEGFGIVFIEAMVCGIPVIAGNQDGSVDALQNGELGRLVNPTSVEDIRDTIRELYRNKYSWSDERKVQLQQKTLNYFGFDQYKKRLRNILSEPDVLSV